MWSSRMYEMSKIWESEGEEVTIITAPYAKSDLHPGRNFITKRKYDGLNLIVVNAADNNTLFFFRRVFNQLVFSFFSVYYSLTLKYDIIITSSGPIFVSFSGIVAKFVRKKKFVFELRDKWPDGAIELGHIKNEILIRILKKFEKFIYRTSDLIVAASVGMKQAIEYEGVENNIFVAPNACDISYYNSQKNRINDNFYPAETKIFLYFGSIGLMDDVLYLVEEFEEAKLEDTVFLIFGDGAEKSKLESYIKEKEVSNIILMGIVPKFEVFFWLEKAYVSLIAYKNYKSLQDSSPNKLFDSLAFGVPVLHNTTGWIKDLVNENEIGLSANPNITGDMTACIKFIFDNPDIREIYSKNALEITNKSFNRTKISSDYLRQLHSINLSPNNAI